MLRLHFSPIKQFLKKIAGLGFLGGALALTSIAEYGLACLLLILSAAGFFAQISEWNIFPKSKVAGRLVKITLYIATVVALVVFLVIFVRQKGDKPWTNLKKEDVSYALAYLGYLHAVRWSWVIPSAALGALVVWLVMKRRQANLRCPNKRLHKIAESDQEQLRQLVKIYGVNCKTEISPDGPPPHVDFIFAIYNLALHQVSIEDAITGKIMFHKDGFRGDAVGLKLRREPTVENNFARKCLFRGEHQFTVRQDLTPEEVTYILSGSKDSLFRFAALTVSIQTQEIAGARLDTNLYVKINERYWAEPRDYVFGGDEERDVILKGLSAYLLEGRALLQKAVEGQTDYLTEAVTKWERSVADYLATHLTRYEQERFLADDKRELYKPMRDTNAKPRFLNRIHTRLVRLESLIQKLTLGSPIIRD